MSKPPAPDLGSTQFWEQVDMDPERLAAEVCFIDVPALDLMLQRHASLHAWVAAAYELARVDEEKAKWGVVQAEAEALLLAREQPDQVTGKPKIADVLKAEAATAKEVKAAMKAQFSAARRRAALRGMDKGLEARSDMLVQLSARQRREHDNYR